MISDDQLKEWRALCLAATPGPWPVAFDGSAELARNAHIRADDGNLLITIDRRRDFTDPLPDAAFIAASRTAVPALLDEVERLRRLTTEARTALAEIEEGEKA